MPEIQKKNTESKNVKAARIKNGRIMLFSKCIKLQEANRLLSSLGAIVLLDYFVLRVLNRVMQGIKWMK